MNGRRWWQDSYGWKMWVMVVFVILCVVLGSILIAGIVAGIIYCVEGCLINKGHSSPHISDGCYEYHITDMEFPRQENQKKMV